MQRTRGLENRLHLICAVHNHCEEQKGRENRADQALFFRRLDVLVGRRDRSGAAHNRGLPGRSGARTERASRGDNGGVIFYWIVAHESAPTSVAGCNGCRRRAPTHHQRRIGIPPGGALGAIIPQVLEHFAAALIALFRLFRQGFHHYGADSGMNRGINLTRRNGFLVDNFVDDRGDVLSGERLFAGDHFIEHDAERKNIAAAIHRAPFHLFGRHVAGRAHNVRGLLRGAKLKNLSGAEVGNFDGVVGREHQVGGLDVAVNDVAFMGELQSVASLVQDSQGAGQRERVSAIQKSLEALAFHQFHGDVVQPVFFAGVEDHHDIGVSEQAGGACFGLEPRKEFVMLQAGTFFA